MNSSNLIQSFDEEDDRNLTNNCEKENINFDKENITFDQPKGLVSSTRSSRFSILRSLDPFNPYEDSVKHPEKSSVIYETDFDFNEISERSANTSFNLLNIDDSMEKECLDEEIKTPTKKIEYNMLKNDFVSPQFGNISNISKMLDESSIIEDDVEIGNLIGLSPVKRVIDKVIFDNLKKYHNAQKESWLIKENQLEEKLENLKEDYKTKINDLLIENEETLEKMRSNHVKILNCKQLEKEEILQDLDGMIKEMVAQESDRFVHLILCDQYSDTLREVILEHENSVEKLQIDNKNFESLLKKYFVKIDKYNKVIESLQKNQNVLMTQIEEDKIKLEKLTLDFSENERMLLNTKQSNEEGLIDMKNVYEKRLRVVEVKYKHVENVLSNLKVELNLRVKERDELAENINELLRDN